TASFEVDDVAVTITTLPLEPIEIPGTAEVTATFTVLNTNDSGFGSLRQAILNANAVPGRQRIDFAIEGPGPHTIAPLSPLPAITEAVFIDARSQPGYVSPPVIELAGHRLEEAPPFADGLTVYASQTHISGLAINRFPGAGIRVVEA